MKIILENTISNLRQMLEDVRVFAVYSNPKTKQPDFAVLYHGPTHKRVDMVITDFAFHTSGGAVFDRLIFQK